MKKNGHDTSLEKLYVDKLLSSGLTPTDAGQLGYTYAPPAAVAALCPSFRSLPGLVIPYHDLAGDATGFYRLRYLARGANFGDLVDKTKYVQPPDSGVGVYFPRSLDWPDLAEDNTKDLLITEGELKAAAAAKRGFPCLGLGGVWNWATAAMGQSFLPALEAVVWRARRVFIVFDSDAKDNPQVVKAMMRLAAALVARGAFAHTVTLPDVVAGGKTGLDDYLLSEPDDDQVISLLESSPASTAAGRLWELNGEVVYVRDPGLIVVQGDGRTVGCGAFVDHAYANREYVEQTFDAKGNAKLVTKSLPKSWLKWPQRFELQKQEYLPGYPRIVGDRWNTWVGWACEPAESAVAEDVQPFLDLLDHLFGDRDPAARDWLIRWLAYPLRYPGTKLTSSALLWGRVHGTGKSLVGYTMKAIYGKNFSEIKEGDISATHNEWAQNCQFVLADDVTGGDKLSPTMRELIKKIVSQKQVRVNIKFVPSYAINDVMNYLWTANQPDPLFLEDTDRRYFIWEVIGRPLSEEFYVEYGLWLDGAAPKLFRWLLDYELGDFNPNGPAYETQAKRAMILDTKSDLGLWCQELAESPDDVLKLGGRKLDADVYQAGELLALFDPEEKTRVTKSALARELKRAGLERLAGGEPVRIGGVVARWFIVRNVERWRNATPAKLVDAVSTARRTTKYT